MQICKPLLLTPAKEERIEILGPAKEKIGAHSR
jgi:hypothetical protein